MMQPSTNRQKTTSAPRKTGWGMPLGTGAAVICAVGLWGRFGGVTHGSSIAATVLAAGVLALTLVLAVTTSPRAK